MTIRDDDRGGVLLNSFAGDDPLEEKDRLRSEGLLNDGFGSRGYRSPRRRAVATVQRETPPVDPSESKRRALSIWDSAAEPFGTIADTYLSSRGIDLPSNAGAYIRFESRCPFGHGNRQACLIALFRDVVTSEPQGIQRTALTRDGVKVGRKMLGPIANSAIKIDGEFGGNRHPLGIAEGLETALSIRKAGWQPIWAIGSAGSMRNMPFVATAELMIFADHDLNGTGQQAAFALQRRWLEGGQRASVQIPADVGDFNDALMRAIHAGA